MRSGRESRLAGQPRLSWRLSRTACKGVERGCVSGDGGGAAAVRRTSRLHRPCRSYDRRATAPAAQEGRAPRCRSLGGVEHGTSRFSDGAFEQTERKRTQVNAWEAPSFTPVRFTFSSVAPKHARSERVTATRTTGRDGAYYVLALPGCTVTSRVRVGAQEKKENVWFRSVGYAFARWPIRPSQSLTHSLTRATP